MFVKRSMSKDIQCSCSRLFDGLGVAAFAAALVDGLYFALYELPFLGKFSNVWRSSIAAVSSAVATSPFWLVVTQKQLSTHSVNTWQLARTIYKVGGWKAFYASLSMDIIMCIFPVVRQVLLQITIDLLHIRDPEHVAFAASVCSIVATIITFPIQKWRVALQSNEHQTRAVKETNRFCQFNGLQFKVMDTCMKTFVLFLVKEHVDNIVVQFLEV